MVNLVYFTRLRIPVVASSLLVLPLIVLEYTNQQNTNASFPFFLMGVLWLLPVIFFWLLLSSLKDYKYKENSLKNSILFWSKIVLLLIVTGLWLVILEDQIPCFLGIPNCD